MSRTGVLSDASVISMCSTHFPLPMNYNLPRNTNVSPFHSKKLKYQPAVSRPDTFNSLKMSMAKLGGASEEELTSMYAAELRNNIHASDINRPRPPQTFGGGGGPGGPGGGGGPDDNDDDDNDNGNGNENINENDPGFFSADEGNESDNEAPDTTNEVQTTPLRNRMSLLASRIFGSSSSAEIAESVENTFNQERSTQTEETQMNPMYSVQGRITELERHIQSQQRQLEQQDEDNSIREQRLRDEHLNEREELQRRHEEEMRNAQIDTYGENEASGVVTQAVQANMNLIGAAVQATAPVAQAIGQAAVQGGRGVVSTWSRTSGRERRPPDFLRY